MSPLQYHPSRNTASVASGDFQYPSMNCGPRITSSPISPGRDIVAVLIHYAAIRLRHRRAYCIPADTVQASRNPMCVTGEASVMP